MKYDGKDSTDSPCDEFLEVPLYYSTFFHRKQDEQNRHIAERAQGMLSNLPNSREWAAIRRVMNAFGFLSAEKIPIAI